MLTKEKLHEMMQEKTRNEIAKEVGVGLGTISNWIKYHQLSYEEIRLSKYPSKLTDGQKEFITGSLLGDGYISKRDGLYSLTQQTSHRQYVEWVYKFLKPFSKNLAIATWEGGTGTVISTVAHPIFKELRKKWYPQGIKIVPNDIILSPFSLAIWYMDDGDNHVSTKSKNIRLHTQSFTENNIDLLIEKLRVFDIQCSKHKDRDKKIINVKAESYFRFIEIVKPFILKCFNYKIDTSKAPADRQEHIDYKPIIDLYDNGMGQIDIANKLKISKQYTCKILVSHGRRTYKKRLVQSDVKQIAEFRD